VGQKLNVGLVGARLDHRAELHKEEKMERSKLRRLAGRPKRNLATERKKEKEYEQATPFCTFLYGVDGRACVMHMPMIVVRVDRSRMNPRTRMERTASSACRWRTCVQ
jgi:hypothetical protein